MSTRRQIREKFSNAALSYDTQALFQRSETERLAATALNHLPASARIIDLGCGTGYFAELVSRDRPQWKLLGIDVAYDMCRVAKTRLPALQGDAMQLPIASRSCDALVSTLCLQWVENLPAAFREIARVLKPGGAALISTLGNHSLYELRERAAAVGLPLQFLPMRDAASYQLVASQHGLEIAHFRQDMLVRHYASVVALLDSMRRIGAGSSFTPGARGMLGARRWKELLTSYETLRQSKGLPATWEALFMILRKPL